MGTRKKQKDRWSNRMATIGIALVVFCLGMAVNMRTASLKKRGQEYIAKEEALMKQVEQEQKRAEELEEYRIYVQTKEYVEEVAKQKLGLVKPDEILLKPVPKQ